jgi:hypothetical protein
VHHLDWQHLAVARRSPSAPRTPDWWGINPRHWLLDYLTACAENGASPPAQIDAFLPWAMDDARRVDLSRPYACRAPPAELLPIGEDT